MDEFSVCWSLRPMPQRRVKTRDSMLVNCIVSSPSASNGANTQFKQRKITHMKMATMTCVLDPGFTKMMAEESKNLRRNSCGKQSERERELVEGKERERRMKRDEYQNFPVPAGKKRERES